MLERAVECLRDGAHRFTLFTLQVMWASTNFQGKRPMAWTTPTLVEICLGLEINGYLPAEF
jgi:coenzyme PQQ precursor peptide PqqA